MDIERPKTTIDVESLIGMVQYYRDMWKSHSHILAPLTEAIRGPKGSKITWTDELEQAIYNNLKEMVSADTIL